MGGPANKAECARRIANFQSSIANEKGHIARIRACTSLDASSKRSSIAQHQSNIAHYQGEIAQLKAKMKTLK